MSFLIIRNQWIWGRSAVANAYKSMNLLAANRWIWGRSADHTPTPPNQTRDVTHQWIWGRSAITNAYKSLKLSAANRWIWGRTADHKQGFIQHLRIKPATPNTSTETLTAKPQCKPLTLTWIETNAATQTTATRSYPKPPFEGGLGGREP